jgi:hypothetical protein
VPSAIVDAANLPDASVVVATMEPVASLRIRTAALTTALLSGSTTDPVIASPGCASSREGCRSAQSIRPTK